jgi:bacillithiol biosynthesis deacetylase BshB1
MTGVSSTPGPCDLLVLVAHPDDAELNCGGTLALSAVQGWKTGVVDFTRGELGTRGTPEIRGEEAAAAARVLGLTYRINLGLPDGHLRDTDEARRLVVELLRAMRPSVVIAPPREDHHSDHAAAAEIVANSFYLAGVGKYCPGLEPWRPHALLHYAGSRAAVPQIVVDTTSVHERRMEAVRCYRSQLYNPESREGATRIALPEFLDWIEGKLSRHGFLIGARYGEAYTSPDPVPISDPVRILGRGKWEKHPGAKT